MKNRIIYRRFRYRMYPSRVAEKTMFETLEVCRRVYNELLEISRETYQNTGKGLTQFDMNRCIRYLDSHSYTVHSNVLQNVSDRLDKTFRHFFRRIRERHEGKKIKAGYPRFKKKGAVKSFTYPQKGFKLDNHILYLAKIGKVNLRIGRKQNRVEGKIKTLTIKKMPSGKWFAIFACEIEARIRRNKNKRKVGIDVGLESFATLSDGTVIENHRFLVKSEKILKIMGRRLSRKEKGSKRREKARIKLARIYEKIHNQRYDFLHKTTKMLVNKFSYIAVENLNIKGMVRHPYLAKHINDASWNCFIEMLGYKAESGSGRVVKVNSSGTSQICSQCGNIVLKTLAVRWHKCPICGLQISRDLNSARLMLNRATAGTAESHACGDGSPLLGEILEGSPSGKQEIAQRRGC